MGKPMIKYDKPIINGHWYDGDGNPHHIIARPQTKKSIREGKPPTFRATTLRDARKHIWYPSVSKFIKIMQNDGLIKWSDNLFLATTYENPAVEGEKFKSYRARILEHINYLKNIAPKRGDKIHKALEDFFGKGIFDKKYAEILDAVDQYYKSKNYHIAQVEQRLVPKTCGYGGQMDIRLNDLDNDHCPVLLDYKSQETAKSGVSTYDSHIIQLCGYKQGLVMERGHMYKRTKLIILYVSADEAGRIEERVITKEEEEKGLKMFNLCYELWCTKNNYRPPIEKGE